MSPSRVSSGLPPALGYNERHARPLLTWLICALLIAATVMANQSAIHWRVNLADSHLFAYYGWCVAHGARPYLDVWDNKPPGIWWTNAAGFTLCGEGLGAELLICTIALITSLAALTAIARTACHRSLTIWAAVVGCVLLTHPIYEGGANRTETFVVTCETLAILGYVRWLRNGKLSWLILGGLAAGAAPFFKQSGLAAGAACALHLAYTQWRAVRTSSAPPWQRAIWKSWLVAAGASAVAPALAIAILFRQGALREAWKAVGPFNQAYFVIGDATWFRLDRAIAVYWEVITPLGWLLAAAAAGAIGVIGARIKAPRASATGDRPTYAGLFWLWFLFAAYLACVGPGRRGHHLMPVLPSLALLALYLLHRLAGAGGLAARVRTRPTSAIVLVIFAYALGQLAISGAEDFDHCWAEKPHWYATEFSQTPGYQLQAAEIRRLTQPDEPIYVWGWSPGTYRFAYRLPASRFATLEKLGQLGTRAQFILDGAMSDVRRREPRLMAISDPDLLGMMAEPRSDFAHWVAKNYEDRGVIGGMHILLRPPTGATR